VFEHGKPIGFATLNQLTFGVQVGGQTFSELVMFTTKDALDTFKRSKLSFTANASAVIVKAGATGTSSPATTIAKAYSRGGMLLEASLGGQKFTYKKHLGKDHKSKLAGLFKKKSESGDHHDVQPRVEAQEGDGAEPMEAEGADRAEAEEETTEAEAAGTGDEEQQLEGEGEQHDEEAQASGAEAEEEEQQASGAEAEEEEQQASGAEEAEEEQVEEPAEEPEEQQAAPEESQEDPEEQRAASPEEAAPEEPIEEPEPPPKPARAAPPPMTHKKSGAPTKSTQPRRRA
jgi:hypothetical protein